LPRHTIRALCNTCRMEKTTVEAERRSRGSCRVMSAMGQKQTLESGLRMSALPPEADMVIVDIDVCLVP
jgi:hypothetical protein